MGGVGVLSKKQTILRWDVSYKQTRRLEKHFEHQCGNPNGEKGKWQQCSRDCIKRERK